MLRWCRQWRALPVLERAAARIEARTALSAGFAGFSLDGSPGRNGAIAALKRAGATESELRDLLHAFDAWHAGGWNDVHTIVRPDPAARWSPQIQRESHGR